MVPPLADPYIAREPVRREMVAWFERCRAERRPCLMNLHGLEGLGVSCQATQFHRDNHRAIGGPLIWLAGRDSDGRPTTSSQLLGEILTGLGVPAADQSASETGRAQACRRLLADAACMIVIDDLVVKAQIEHLLSLDAPRVVLVVTTPLVRRDLRADGFHAFTPEVLSTVDARTLFLDRLGNAVLPESTVDDLLALCGGLPLLVKIVAAQLDGRAHIAEPLLTELREARLDLFELDDDRRMRGFFDVAYDRLPNPLARLYRTLPLLPGPDFGVDVVAAAVDQPVSTVHLALAQLVDHNLLVSPAPNRFTFHPVVRVDARARARDIDAPEQRRAVVERAVRWYLGEALWHAAPMSGRWWVEPVTALMRELVGDRAAADRTAANAWFRAELANLVAAVSVADRLAWPLCVALWKYLHVHQLHTEWVATHQIGLAAARRFGDTAGVMQVSSQLGAAHLGLGETRLAGECFTESLTAAREIGHALGEQSAIEWLGKTAAAEGRFADALDHYRRSWEFTASSDIEDAQRARIHALLLLQQARAHVGLADWPAAATDATAAMRYFDDSNETDNRAKCRVVLGDALAGGGDAARAARVFDEALELFTREDARGWQAEVCVRLAAVDPGRAAELYGRALDYYESVGAVVKAGVVRERLTGA